MESLYLKLPIKVNDELVQDQLIGIRYISRISPFKYNNNTYEYSKIEFQDRENCCIAKISFDALAELIKQAAIDNNLLLVL